MKWFLSLTLVLFTTAAMACEDFTGNYRAGTGETYSISQSGCASVTINSSQGTETVVMDGQFRVVSEDESTIVTMAGSFVGETGALLDSRIQYKISFPPEFPADMIPVRVTVEYSLNAENNLVSVLKVLNANGGIIETKTSVDQRI